MQPMAKDKRIRFKVEGEDVELEGRIVETLQSGYRVFTQTGTYLCWYNMNGEIVGRLITG